MYRTQHETRTRKKKIYSTYYTYNNIYITVIMMITWANDIHAYRYDIKLYTYFHRRNTSDAAAAVEGDWPNYNHYNIIILRGIQRIKRQPLQKSSLQLIALNIFYCYISARCGGLFVVETQWNTKYNNNHREDRRYCNIILLFRSSTSIS